MEIRELVRIAAKHIKFLVGIGILAGLASAWFMYTQPAKYEGSVSFTINRVNTIETLDYQYDGYYGIKAAELFGQTLVSWMETPSILLSMYKEAQVEPHISSLNSFTGRFNAKLYSPQNMVVTFKEGDEENAHALAKAISEVVVQKSEEANQLTTGESLFHVVAEPSVVVEQKINSGLAGLVGGLAGVLIGIVLVALRYYLQNNASRD